MAYGFDPAGNLNYRTNNALIQNFAVNSDNELTTATNGGTLTVVGTTTSATVTNVTVNGTNALRYGDATFAATNMPLTTAYTALAQEGTNNGGFGRRATNTVTVSLSTNISFQYDGNGNLTYDGLRSFAYDDENQLIQVWVPGQWFSLFSYDGKMRRRIRQEFTWTNSAWLQTNAVYYVYDGNLVIYPVRYERNFLLRVRAKERSRQSVLHRLFRRSSRSACRTPRWPRRIHSETPAGRVDLLRSLPKSGRRVAAREILKDRSGENDTCRPVSAAISRGEGAGHQQCADDHLHARQGFKRQPGRRGRHRRTCWRERTQMARPITMRMETAT